jgi:hypothetical protein
MPGQQCLRRDDRCQLRQSPASKSFRSDCETAALIVRESRSASAELLAQDPVLLTQVLNRLLLLLIHPASHGDEHKPDRIENATHASTVSGVTQ